MQVYLERVKCIGQNGSGKERRGRDLTGKLMQGDSRGEGNKMSEAKPAGIRKDEMKLVSCSRDKRNRTYKQIIFPFALFMKYMHKSKG